MRGIGDNTKRRALFQYHRANSDFLVLQETHSFKECERIWESEWGGKILFAHGESNARGVAVLISKEIFKLMSNVYIENDGRLIVFDYIENSQKITIAVVYAPNSDSPEFFGKVTDILRERMEHKIIIGDFNLVLDVDLDRKNTYSNNNRAKERVEDMMDEFCLKDIWRVQNPDSRQYSWFKRGNLHKCSRIDFALVSGGIDQRVKLVDYISSIKTDHRAIYLMVELNQNERGAGFWKMNTSFLQQQQYLDLMNVEISRTIETSQHKNACEVWESLKARIKKTSIRYAREKVREDQIIVANLSEKVNEYEARLPLTQVEDEILVNTKADLEEKLMEKARGAIFRSKVRWYEEGEKSTKYFYSLEKVRYNAKTSFKMINEENQEIVEQSDILKYQKDFYQQLYSIDQDVEFTLQNNSGVKVPIEIKKEQDLQISVAELGRAIKEMNNNKTPGIDGIPVDFYKVFWNKLHEPFYNMVLEVYNKTKLHETARKGVLNLIPKAGKDTRFIKNLRPITLLNTDYKIIEKVIANKMLPALKEIIGKDQRGFMKHRRISVNIRKMLDIIQEAKDRDIEAVVLSLDFVKCFDKCSFSILHGSLQYFGFAELIREWTKILYRDFTVTIQNNGYMSDEIQIEKGVHQGGCCSSVYFLVIAEILAIALRGNEEIEGITIRDIKNLLNQFADDMDVFSLGQEHSIKQILEELDKFRLQSGFQVSYEKTTLYRIGSLRHSDAQLYDISQVKWSNQDINVLGVTIAHEDIIEKNYYDLVEKAKRVLNSWYNRGLSLCGKIQVVNALVASLFVYKMMVLPLIPKNIIKRVDNVIRDFLWNGKKSKISYAILQNHKDQGGLGLVNLERKDRSLKATWPKILENEVEYAKMVYAIMRCSGIGKEIWRCSLKKEDVRTLGIQNQFWRDVLESWCEYNYYLDRKIENQILWYNSNIKVKGKVCYWQDVHHAGLLYIHQLYEDQKLKSDERVWQEFRLTKLRYNSLKTSIPIEWKSFFLSEPKTAFLPLPPHNYHKCLMQPHFSSQVYKCSSDDVMLLHNKYLKWRVDLGSQMEDHLVRFGQRCKEVYKLTNVAK